MTNTYMGRSCGPAMIFSDTPIAATHYTGTVSYLDMGEGTVVENYVTGAEPWFQSYGATSAATMVSGMLGGTYNSNVEAPHAYYHQLYLGGFPVALTPTKEYGTDKLQAFNAIMATNAARTDDPFAQDYTAYAGLGSPYTDAKINGEAMSTTVEDGNGAPPRPQYIGGRWYQHIPTTMPGAGANAMQVIIEIHVADAAKLWPTTAAE